MPTVAQFLVEFPEFAPAFARSAAFVQAKLDHAARFCDAGVWGTRYERAVYLRAAHLIAMSPFGENARLAKGSRDTIYSVMFDDEIVALPIRMAIV